MIRDSCDGFLLRSGREECVTGVMTWSGISPGRIRTGGAGCGGRGGVALGFGGGTRAASNKRLVDVGREESGVRVPVHQCVDLQLGVFEGVRGGVLHLLVDHLSNPGIQTHLGRHVEEFREAITRIKG